MILVWELYRSMSVNEVLNQLPATEQGLSVPLISFLNVLHVISAPHVTTSVSKLPLYVSSFRGSHVSCTVSRSVRSENITSTSTLLCVSVCDTVGFKLLKVIIYTISSILDIEFKCCTVGRGHLSLSRLPD